MKYRYRLFMYRLERYYRRIVGLPPGEAVRRALMSPAELLAERNRIRTHWIRWEAKREDYQFVKYDVLLPNDYVWAAGQLVIRRRGGRLIELIDFGFDEIEIKWPTSARA